MRALRNSTVGVVAFLLAATQIPSGGAAISLDLARKCNALMAKEFPPREPGNPAAGSAKGNGQAARDYFKKCVDNNGNVDSTANKNSK